MTRERVIGKDNRLPWHLPADLAHFRAVTWGGSIIMGRKTHESIGRPLPGRRNWVLSRSPAYHAAGCEVATSLTQVLELEQPQAELFVIGGAELYVLALPQAQRLYCTWVHTQVVGDAWFPPLNLAEWQVRAETLRTRDEANQYDLSFQLLERVGLDPLPVANLGAGAVRPGVAPADKSGVGLQGG